MNSNKVLNRLLSITIIVFVLISLATIPITEPTKMILKPNIEVQDISKKTNIFLQNKDGYLVKTEIILEEGKKENKIRKIIEYLKEDNKSIPKNLTGYLPSNTQLLDVFIDRDYITLNFSKELLKTECLDQMVAGIVYSLLEIPSIKKISLKVEEKEIPGYEEILTNSIAINPSYQFINRKDLSKVVIYYFDKEKNLVPVTKYINDKREKIEIIVDELKNSQKNLVSYLDDNIELLDYQEEGNVLILNFNKQLKNNSDDITDYNLQSIASSVFNNYGVNTVMFEIDKTIIKYVKKSE